MSDLIGALIGIAGVLIFNSVFYPLMVNWFYWRDPHCEWYAENYNRLPKFLQFVKGR